MTSYGLIDSAKQYQTLKIIQNTVRVPSSLYTMNLGALSVFQSARNAPYKVNWNQMSDRVVRHYQTNSSFSQGSSYHGSSTRHTHTGSKPGSTTPGGAGVDIKHNSYYRYLARLKGKGPVRRGPIPVDFGKPILFNPVYPIYGGKTMKTSIVADCNCPIDDTDVYRDEYKLYHTFFNPAMFVANYTFVVGQQVWAKPSPTNKYLVATITEVLSNNTYNLVFSDGSGGTSPYDGSELLIYYPCNCAPQTTDSFNNEYDNLKISVGGGKEFLNCLVINAYSGADAIRNFLLLIWPLIELNINVSQF